MFTLEDMFSLSVCSMFNHDWTEKLSFSSITDDDDVDLWGITSENNWMSDDGEKNIFSIDSFSFLFFSFSSHFHFSPSCFTTPTFCQRCQNVASVHTQLIIDETLFFIPMQEIASQRTRSSSSSSFSSECMCACSFVRWWFCSFLFFPYSSCSSSSSTPCCSLIV